MTAFKGPLDFYFYEPTSQHGDFNTLFNCLHRQNLVSVSYNFSLQTHRFIVRIQQVPLSFININNTFLHIDTPLQIFILLSCRTHAKIPYIQRIIEFGLACKVLPKERRTLESLSQYIGTSSSWYITDITITP